MGWEKVEAVLPYAKAIVWDGCHKIYLAMDDEQIKQFEKYGYGDPKDSSLLIRIAETPERPGAGDAALETLQQWFDESCGLRFIQAVRTDPTGEDKFDNLIEQFELDDDEEDDEDGDDE